MPKLPAVAYNTVEKVPVEAVNPCVTVMESALKASLTCALPKLPLLACNEVEKVPVPDSMLELKVPEAADTVVVEINELAATEPVKTPEPAFNCPPTCASPKLPLLAPNEPEKVPVEAVNPCATATESALNSSFTWALPKLPLLACSEVEKVPETPDTLVVEIKLLAATEPVKTPEPPFN